jgi:hypothetical protein
VTIDAHNETRSADRIAAGAHMMTGISGKMLWTEVRDCFDAELAKDWAPEVPVFGRRETARTTVFPLGGWCARDAHELVSGEPYVRKDIKLVEWDEIVVARKPFDVTEVMK